MDGLEDLLQIRLYGLQCVQVLETLVYRLVVKTAWSKTYESVHVEKVMYNTLVREYSKNLQIATFAVLVTVNIRLADYLLVIT